MPVEDYYSLIGVSADADRDAIKDAYRARRSELDDSEAGKQNAARLNRAWNVLSDASQRERYDDELATARAEGDEVIVPELVAAAPSTAGMSKAQRRRAANQAGKADRPPLRQAQDQETTINGIPLASNKDRVRALVIDAFICLLILMIGTVALSSKVADSQKPEVVANIDRLTDEAKALKKVEDQAKTDFDKAKKAVTSAEKGKDSAKIEQAKSDQKAAEAKAKQATADLKAKNKALDKEDAKLSTIRLVCFLLGVALCFVLLAVPSMVTGRSPGKFARKLRLVADDGSKATPAKVAVHYGVVLGFIGSLGAVLGPIAMAVAMFGVSSFTRSPTRQGWHDRIAKTRVVQG